jgi:isocitrate/isopropylmalate dehydrogenase
MTVRVLALPGDDAAPEAVRPSVALLKRLAPTVVWEELPSGEEGLARYGREGFTRLVQEAIDRSHTTLFGAGSGKTPGTTYLRWAKDTYANVRPVRWRPGFRSPLRRPEGIDYVIVRENLEDVYVRVEGPLSDLAPLAPRRSRDGRAIDTAAAGAYAVKVITEAETIRLARFAGRLALARQEAGRPGRVTCAAKHNVLPRTDGLFVRLVEQVVRDEFPSLIYEQFIVDDFARRLVATPQELDVVVLPNQYGDILSDEAAGTIGGLGLAPSGCYGDTYAYFESVHGTAPDIAGRHIINPTATLLSAVLMLEYLGRVDEARALDRAISAVYAEGRCLTPDQGGTATTEEFCAAVAARL